jgi:hypothetical protein
MLRLACNLGNFEGWWRNTFAPWFMQRRLWRSIVSEAT